ncbi:hypothetical protein ACJJTC_017667 [Scirpophaga incertulas]
MSIIVNPSENLSVLDDSRTITAPNPSENSATATVHTENENPILEIPITDDPLNKFSRQLILTVVGDIKGRTIVTKPFETHTRIAVQISETNLEEDVISAIKEYVNPKIKTVPNKNNEVLVPPSPFLAIFEKDFKHIEAECPKTSKWFLCIENQSLKRRPSEDCIHQLITTQQRSTTCNPVTVTLDQPAYDVLDDRHYTINFPNPTKPQRSGVEGVPTRYPSPYWHAQPVLHRGGEDVQGTGQRQSHHTEDRQSGGCAV